MTNDTLAKLAADNVPERIYLVLGEDIAPDDDPRADFDDLADVNWCIDKQFEHDIEYVRADVAALTAQALPAAEPFGYFKAEPFGWADCAPTAEGAIALYEHPQQAAPAPAGWLAVKIKRDLFSFSSERQWVNKAQSWYANCGVQKGFYITVDAAGYIMHRGLCFKHAAYPVTCYELETNWANALPQPQEDAA